MNINQGPYETRVLKKSYGFDNHMSYGSNSFKRVIWGLICNIRSIIGGYLGGY